MTPYADFLYFGLVLYPAVPTLLLGLSGRWSRWWTLLGGLALLAVQYWEPLRLTPTAQVSTLWIVLAWVLFQWMLAEGLLWLKGRAAGSADVSGIRTGSSGASHGGWLIWPAGALALAPLVVAKFLPLVAPHDLFGFLGISYVTFRAMDVLFGIQDGLIKSLQWDGYLGFLLFVPTISAGPIDRYKRFLTDWNKVRTRPEFLTDVDGAIQRLFRGFLYKFIVGYLIAKYWMNPVASQHGFWAIVSYMYAYSFYLFFDFAGYSAFATGFGYLFGIHTPENFDLPFLARNIREFWNRWHISLSFWLRDHVYMRFVMSATRGKWFKNRNVAAGLGYLLSMGLMGLWHGTAWYYLLYGLYHALLMAGFDALNRWNKVHKIWKDGLLWQAAGVFVTFQTVCLGLLLFSGRLAR